MSDANALFRGSLPLLTIAIPTYNRAEYLDVCLRRIAEELYSLSDSQRKLIIVYVSNNGSSDNTCDVLRKYEGVIESQFFCVNNISNIGADKNIMQCYSSATTPYVWVLGDDDVILFGGLQIVLDTLVEKKDLDILYLSGYSYSDSYLDEPNNGRGGNGVVEYSSALNFVRQTHIMLTFITALIVRSGVCLEPFGKLVDGSNLSQMSWILSLIRNGEKFAIIKNRVYAAKIANSGGYSAAKVFGNNLSNIAKSILVGQSNLVNTIENGAIVMWFPIYIVNLRRGDTVEFPGEDFSVDLRRVYKGNWRYYFFLMPLIFIPKFLVPMYFLFIRLVRKVFRTSLI
jgi:abequosyltransferase